MHFSFKLTNEQKDHLLIRHLKRSHRNYGVIKTIVGMYYALDSEYVTDRLVSKTLMEVVERYNLMNKDWKEFICDLQLEGDKWLGRKDRTLDEALFEEVSRYIQMSDVSKFGFYTSPAWSRNHQKQQEVLDQMAKEANPPLDCSDEELVTYIESMEDGERVIELGVSGQKGWKGTIYHNKDGDTCIRWDALPDGGQLSTSFTGGARRIPV
jgi:hypothetical protein